MGYFLLISFAIFLAFMLIDRPLIVIAFKDGQLVRHKGKVPKGFLHDCQDIAKRHPFTGTVKVYSNRFKPAKVVMSRSVDNRIQQRIKNVFPHQSFK
ncbi:MULTISPECIES: DUF3634 family protein [Salinivibrio]|uniref:DUF3634 family protein n=1 Tax=Salinivibrio TaxID=51366 RepID=UPI0009840EFF|nr:MULTISPECIES: DUF3634 family protein [Salinivibrio]OOE43624.1 hypothetical protein BZG10_15040 [Salinivibrio kushneri]OOE58040.1 hypothetical protein BZG13_08200 [Salinivibrio sp. ML323]OOE59657.1 hypothetical protein BZG18_12630 [Salinivibrio kushneri]